MAFCKNCGNKLEDGAKFCPKCGTARGGGIVQQETNRKKSSSPWIIALAVLAILFGSYFVTDMASSDSQGKSSGLVNIPMEIEEDSQSGKSLYSGTYKLEGGYTLTVNENETARLRTPDGIKYAASVTCWVIDYISINIDWDIDNILKINGHNIYIPVIGKEKDYLYFDVSAYNSKNEEKRIRIISFKK